MTWRAIIGVAHDIANFQLLERNSSIPIFSKDVIQHVYLNPCAAIGKDHPDTIVEIC